MIETSSPEPGATHQLYQRQTGPNSNYQKVRKLGGLGDNGLGQSPQFID